ncbi:MAG: hypothetical protein KDF55_02195 [Thauera sp.]|nr:hypothetical protein [Thauera sp.]
MDRYENFKRRGVALTAAAVLLGLTAGAAGAAEKQAGLRELLEAADPLIHAAVVSLEQARGHVLSEAEIRAALKSDELAERHEALRRTFCAAPKNGAILACRPGSGLRET